MRVEPTVLNGAQYGQLPSTLSLLCWNLHKQSPLDPVVGEWLERVNWISDLMLFQEAAWQEPFSLDKWQRYDVAAVANLKWQERHYGVMNLSLAKVLDAEGYLSMHREMGWTTRKGALFCRYRVDGSVLLTVNVHMLNFHHDVAYEDELARLQYLLERYEGALILAGDFNTWNRKRTLLLKTMCRRLKLRHVAVKGVRRFGRYALDHLFYRGVRMVDASVLQTHRLSDHHPIRVHFMMPRSV